MPGFLPLEALARRLPALPASCGPVRLVGVDGHAGSGKTTCARQLADSSADKNADKNSVPVLHLDDVAAHDALFDWTARLSSQVLRPLEQGRMARYDIYDWVAGAYTAQAELAPAPVVLVEGVGAGRAALRPYLAALLWMDMPAAKAWQRGRHRDGAAQRDFWARWIPAERAHFAADPSRPFADFLVRETDEHHGRYEVREGPAGTQASPENMTLRTARGG